MNLYLEGPHLLSAYYAPGLVSGDAKKSGNSLCLQKLPRWWVTRQESDCSTCVVTEGAQRRQEGACKGHVYRAQAPGELLPSSGQVQALGYKLRSEEAVRLERGCRSQPAKG